MKQLNEELFKILNSESGKQAAITNIKYLMDSGILDKLENDLCQKILSNYEIYGSNRIFYALKELNIETNNLQNIKGYSGTELFEKIDQLILERRTEENNQILKNGLAESAAGVFDKKTLKAYFNRYASLIDVTPKNTFLYLDIDYITPPPKSEISTAQVYIDQLLGGGLPRESITTIIGNSDYYKSLWATNIAYSAMESGKNVLYILLGVDDEALYKRLLARHSCNEKFEKPITLEELNTKFDKKVYEKVYYDFKANFLNRLIVYDESEFYISTYHSLQKLLVYAQNKFLEEQDSGVDLLIIDDFTYMKLDNGHRSITNQNTIINEYYKFLKNQAMRILGTSNGISIVTTLCANDKGTYLVKNNGEFELAFVPDEARIKSDNILSIYGDKNLDRANQVKIKVLKSKEKIMEEAESVTVNRAYWHLIYDDSIKEDKDVIIERQEKIIESLEETNKDLTNRILSPTESSDCNFSLEELLNIE